MSILALHEGKAAAAAPGYIAPPKPEPKFNWAGVATALPYGVAEAGMQVLGSAADIGNALAYMRDTPSKSMERGGIPTEQFSSDLGDSLRDRGREFRPDPQTASTAEQLLFGFARGASKIVAGAVAAGPAGVMAAGAEEAFSQSDELRRQGVAVGPRGQSGGVQGAGLALAALPLVGQTLKATAALYVAGGPGGYMAQQALTREILRSAGHDQIAAQFDPFDPVGLAVASLIPAGFAAWGIRGQRMAAAAKAAEDFRTGPVPSEVSPVAAAVRQAYSPEVVDAARVVFATEQRAASNLGDATAHADAHEAALSRAEDQMARGEPVNVAGLAPALADARLLDTQITQLESELASTIPATADLAENGAIREARQQLRLMEQTRVDVSEPAVKATAKGIQEREGVSYKTALSEARKQTEARAADWQAQSDRLTQFIERNAEAQKQTQRAGQIEKQLTALRAQREALPSFVEFGGAIDQLRAARSPEPARATEPTQAANPEGTAPGSAAEPAPGVPGARPAAAEAAGLTPGASAETAAAAARIDGIRAQHPDLMVQIDGMDAPMRMDDFLAAVKAEADELAADAPLMEVAAQCALLNGP